MFFSKDFADSDDNVVVPGVPDHLTRVLECHEAVDFSLRLPSTEELKAKKTELFEKQFRKTAYVKLHGSQGWLSHDGSDVMVIGAQKLS